MFFLLPTYNYICVNVCGGRGVCVRVCVYRFYIFISIYTHAFIYIVYSYTHM